MKLFPKKVSVLALVAVFTVSAAQAADEKKIVLLYTPVDHPPATHMYEFECRLLAKCLEQTPGIKTEVYEIWPEDDSTLDDAAAIVYYSNPAGDIVLSDERKEKFQSLMKKGVGFVGLHWALGYMPYEKFDDYVNILGGAFHFGIAVSENRPPLAVTQETLEQPLPGHPVSRGWTSFELRDEWYLSMRWAEGAQPVAKVRVRADQAQKRPEPIDLTVAWVYERPDSNGGRSFGSSLGHFHDNFGITAFRKLFVNGILWTAHVDIPSEGASVLLAPQDLVLPPDPRLKK